MATRIDRSPNFIQNRYLYSDSLINSAALERPTLSHPSNSYSPLLQVYTCHSDGIQSRLLELRNYLNNSINIQKKHIRQLFDWQEDMDKGENKEQKFLKELSCKVKGLIKENNQFRHNTQAEQLERLKKQNQKLHQCIMDLQRREAARKESFNEDSISRKKDQSLSQQKSTLSHSFQTSNKTSKQSSLIQSSLNIQNLQTLKQYYRNIIKEVIQSNDEKLEAQQRYIDSLQKRLVNLEGMQQKMDHFRCQKKVKLTEYVRKSKNFSVRAPKIKGQDDQTAALQLDKQQPVQQKRSPSKKVGIIARKLFSDKLYTAEKISDHSHQIQIQLLMEQNRILQEKLNLEIETHINDNADKQEIIKQMQQKSLEKMQIQRKYDQLADQQKLNLEKIKDFEAYIDRQQKVKGSFSSTSNIGLQLKQIRETLQSLDKTHYIKIEAQIACLLLERNYLKRQLVALQQTATQSSRFSSFHKQIFFLKEKNSQLEQNCQYYQKQLQSYEAQFQQVLQEGKQILESNISNEMRTIWQEKASEFEGLKWQRDLHFCILNSADRMIKLEKALIGKS